MKRVLIVGYYFVDGNMGTVRLRRIARLLPRHGWEPVVLTHPPAPGARVPPDVKREEVDAPDLAEVYARLRRFGRPSPPATAAARGEPTAKSIGFTSTLNRWLMVPDKQVTWYRAAIRRAREMVRAEKFDAIFASLDPRTTILVAARLSRETGIPCTLEYRDLWTNSPYHHVAQATRLHRWLHRRLERGALRQAAHVSTVCRGIADELNRAYHDVLRRPVELNYNFYDPEEYPDAPRPKPGEGPFVISYTGAMYADRNPLGFFDGLRRFIDAAKLTPSQFRFRWAGSLAGIDALAATLDRTGVRPFLDFLGQIPHHEALKLLLQSHTALLVQAPQDAIHIPGKLFEAMGARVPLLALANPSETADLVNRCHAGVVCPHDPAAIAQGLERFHSMAKTGERWAFNEPEVARFSANDAVKKLAALFEP